MAAPVFTARRDPRLRARIVSDRHLSYEGGPDTRIEERSTHVRAGSGLAWSGGNIVVIQDDADYIAVIQPGGGGATGFRLKSPSAPVARPGREAVTLHLEAVLSVRDWRGEFLVAFGSGARPERRCMARVRFGGGDTELSVFETRKFYAALEDLPDFATTTLNIEGVALVPKGMDGRDGVRLFHRANGKPRAGVPEGRHLSATIDVRLDALLAYLDRCKRDSSATLGMPLLNLRRYDLDEVMGVPFTFTDAAALPDGRVLYLAGAERCEDAGIDGECFGTALGVIDTDGCARYAVIVERDGTPTRRMPEGLAVVDDNSVFVVIDPDGPKDADRPSTLCSIELSGL